MTERFTQIIDRHGKPGRTEKFVNFVVEVSDKITDVNYDLLDSSGLHILKKYTKWRRYEAVKGVAQIEWRDRDGCVADYQCDIRKARWENIEAFKSRMKNGEIPQFAQAYLHPSLTKKETLMVIDGTRRMLAYLELGHKEMPIIIFKAKHKLNFVSTILERFQLAIESCLGRFL